MIKITDDRAIMNILHLGRLIKFLFSYRRGINRLINSGYIGESNHNTKPKNQCVFQLLNHAYHQLIINLSELLKEIPQIEKDIGIDLYTRLMKKRNHLAHPYEIKPNIFLSEGEVELVIKALQKINFEDNRELKEKLGQKINNIYMDEPQEGEIENLIKFMTRIDPRLVDNHPQSQKPSINIDEMTISQFLEICKKEKIKDYEYLEITFDALNSNFIKKDHIKLYDFVINTVDYFKYLFLCIAQIEKTKKYEEIEEKSLRPLINNAEDFFHILKIHK